MALEVTLEDLGRIESRLREVDTGAIDQYLEKIDEIRRVTNSMIAPQYLQDFIIAYDVTNDLLSSVTSVYNMAELLRKTAEANAYLTRAQPYLESINQKETVDSKKYYVAIDPVVQRATLLSQEAERLMISLRGKLQTFRMAHDDVKKMAYAPDYNSPNEGF